MKATVTEPQPWKRVIDIEIPVAEYDEAFNAKVRDYRKKINLPGFRPGKATPSVVRTRFGEAIRAEVLEDMVQKSYEEACRDNNVVPVSQATVNRLKADAGQPVTFSIETEVDPPVSVKGYEKLKVKIAPQKVRNGDIDKVIEDLRERLASYEDAGRPSKKGDFLTITYEKVTVDGQERGDVSSPRYPIELGASKIKEFDKSLSGCEPGCVVTASITFPKDYGDPDIAGRSGEFTIRVDKVQQRVLPEVNDAFFTKIGDFSNEEAMRSRIREDLEKREHDKAKSEAIDKAIEQLIKSNPFEVPPARIASYLTYMQEQLKRYAGDERPAPSREEVEVQYHDTAIRAIKRQRIVDDIATKESIKATQEEVDAQIHTLADQYNRPFDELKQTLRKNGTTQRIRDDIRERKTLDFLVGESTQGE